MVAGHFRMAWLQGSEDMAVKERVRIGGRSARIQRAVHQAVKNLSATTSREELTVPQIAAEAGVTPSTIYRRWGDLAALLADVAVERLRPVADPQDTRVRSVGPAPLHRGIYGGDVVRCRPG